MEQRPTRQELAVTFLQQRVQVERMLRHWALIEPGEEVEAVTALEPNRPPFRLVVTATVAGREVRLHLAFWSERYCNTAVTRSRIADCNQAAGSHPWAVVLTHPAFVADWDGRLEKISVRSVRLVGPEFEAFVSAAYADHPRCEPVVF